MATVAGDAGVADAGDHGCPWRMLSWPASRGCIGVLLIECLLTPKGSCLDEWSASGNYSGYHALSCLVSGLMLILGPWRLGTGNQSRGE